MAGITDRFRAIVRSIVGLPDDPGQPPQIDRLAMYRATVATASSDGKTLDVQPEDKRIPGMKNVPVRVGIPGAVVVVQPGAVVLIGWERGDPARPYAAPAWESGASITSLNIGSSPDAVVTKADIAAIKAAISGASVVANDGGAAFKSNIIAAWPTSVGSNTVGVQR